MITALYNERGCESFQLGHYNRFTKTGCACGTFFQNRPFSLAEYFISKLGIFILGRSLFKEHTKG